MSGLRAELERVLGLVAEYCENPRREAQHPDEVGCSEHPDAPHGFCRDASHSEDCYVCECRGWEPDPAKDYDCAYEAIAFLKTHGPALLTGQGEDGRDADALRYELADLHDSVRTLYIACPCLPISDEHPEDFDAATNTLHGLCMAIGIHEISVPGVSPPRIQASGSGAG